MKPVLRTKRLILRRFAMSDAKDVQRLAGHRLIYATTANIPHPYPDGAAEEWISQHEELIRKAQSFPFAITLKDSGALIGCIALFGVLATHKKAEIGYWIGVDYWGQGYCSEAAQAIAKFGFSVLKLNKIVGRFKVGNTASGRILKKIGMKKVGVFKQDFFRDGRFQDTAFYEVLRSEFKRSKTASRRRARA
jgi:RimJ/RimL family protein N-acetyltransferase